MALAGAKPSYYRCLLDVSQQFIESEWTGVLESSLHTIWKVVTDRGCLCVRGIAQCVCPHVYLRECSLWSIFSAFCVVCVSFSCSLVSKSHSSLAEIINIYLLWGGGRAAAGYVLIIFIIHQSADD